jgi:putative ABC transport system permease protein
MKKPPRLADQFLKWFMAPHLLEAIMGDLHEEFHFQANAAGERRAMLLYWRQVIGFFRPQYIKRKSSEYSSSTSFASSMIQNHFKIATRQLVRNKTLSFINIVGLSLGMAFAMLTGMWIHYETGFDAFNINSDRIALVVKNSLLNNRKNTSTNLMLPVYDELRNNYPEIKRVTRIDWGSPRNLVVGDRKFNKTGYFVDADFLKMFTFPVINGNSETALSDPNSIVLTQSFANALFDNGNPVGRIIRIDNRFDLQVSAVITDLPKNSSLEFEFLMPFEFKLQNDPGTKESKTRWNNSFISVAVELKEGVNMDNLSKKIAPILTGKDPFIKAQTLALYPMPRWHLYDYEEWFIMDGRIRYVKLFGLIGGFILLIACINFMNLSTAKFEKRAKEVGVRKAIGSKRRQLVAQFLTESVFMTLLAFLLSVALVWLVLPQLKDVGFDNVRFDISNVSVWVTGLMICILTGLLAGSYPAFYLSSFQPVNVLKGIVFQEKSTVNLRKILVVSQFVVSISLIISTVVVFQQIDHARTRSVGYNPDNLVTLNANQDLIKNYNALKHELINSGYVSSMTKSSSGMTWVNNDFTHFSWEGKDPTLDLSINVVMTEWDYDKTVGLEFTAGRSFDRQYKTDSNSIILNESALKLIGYKDPIGKTMKLGSQPLTIIGITKNVLMQDPFKTVPPGVILFDGDNVTTMLIRLKNGVDLHKSIAAIQSITNKFNPSYPFEYRFVDEDFNKKFATENQVAKLAGIFACLAISISCLGLFGLAMFMAERRSKEVTIRKVLGASAANLWFLLSGEFMWLVAIACIVACPLSFWLMSSWLEKYEYRIDIQWWVLPIAGVIALLIALATVSFQALKAAFESPAKSLRTE